MNVTKKLGKVLLCVSLAGTALPAKADCVNVIQMYHSWNSWDGRPCHWFLTAQDQGNWKCVYMGDAGSQDEWIAVLKAFDMWKLGLNGGLCYSIAGYPDWASYAAVIYGIVLW